MKSTAKIKLDLQKSNCAGIVRALQGDGNTRTVEAELLDGGKPWSVPEDISAAVIYRKPDGTKGFYNELADGTLALEVRGCRVRLILASQMLTVPGTVQAGLLFNDRQLNQLTTFPFTVEVLPSPFTGAEASADHIRLQWLEEKLDERMRLAKESGEFDGSSPELLSHTVAYQVSDSGQAPPAGQWLDEIPALTKGCWLWTRRQIHWSDHDPVTDYSVSYLGQDGQGQVTTVAGISPDAGGNVPLTGADIGALPVTGGAMTGNLSVLTPTEATQAAHKGYVDAGVRAAAPRNLLDNSDFTNLVAQAGIGGNHGTTAYAADRWILDSGTVSYTEGVGLTLNGTIKQRLERTPAGHTSAFVGMASGTASISYADGEVTITSSGGVLKWAALYAGVYTTDTLPVYQPKGYGAELAECQRYYINFITEYVTCGHVTSGATRYLMPVRLPVSMRCTPSANARGWRGRTATGHSKYSNGEEVAFTSISVYGGEGGNVLLADSISSPADTNNIMIEFAIYGLTFSADL